MKIRITVLGCWGTLREFEFTVEQMEEIDAFPTLQTWAASPYASQVGDKVILETKNGITEAVVLEK